MLWETLCETYFQKWIHDSDVVLELGAGYGYFINSVRAARRIAIDAWEDLPKYLSPSIEHFVQSVTELNVLEDRSLDFVFASNLFEHLTQEEFSSVLKQLSFKLKANGILCILQPNYYYAYRQYFDDYTHKTIYTHVSLSDFLNAHDFEVFQSFPKFLPLTLKSKLPVNKFLIQLYLKSPFKPMAGQMLMLSRVSNKV